MARYTLLKTPVTVMAAILTAALLASFTAEKCARGAAQGNTGSSIAFASDRKADADSTFSIYRMDADGNGPKNRLTDTTGANVMPAFSPDGAEIAFVHSGLTGIPDIYRVDADGSNETSLSNGLLFEIEPAWFPGGRKLVFSDSDDLYTMTLDAGGSPTGAPTRLTRNADVDRQPIVSPNGKRIAFASDRDGDFDIYVMKPARESPANRPVRLTRNTVPDTLPDWSPVGGKLAFSKGNIGSRDIYTMRAAPQNSDTNPPVNLTRNTADDSDAAWSPDGQEIAFTSDRSGDGEIWVVGADGTDPSNLTHSPASEDLQPDWQPLP